MLDRLRAFSARLESPRVRPVLVIAIVLFLLVGSAAAFAVAERLKLERSPVATPDIQRILGPVCECPRDTARLSFGLRRADRVTATIVDSNERTVRVLLDDEPRPAGRIILAWDGRSDAGNVVHDGRYRLHVALGRANRAITIPTPIRVDTQPPRVRLISATPNVFSPDGDGRADRVRFRYAVSEFGRVFVFVDEQLAVRGPRADGVADIFWRGRLEGDVAAPGTYSTWLTAVDVAGNESQPTRTALVTIRYVEIDAPPTVRRRGRLTFEIDADAETVAWTLRSPSGRPRLSGTAPPGVVHVRLPRRITRGVYTLVASVPAGTAETTVRVTR
jgi:hypothetical protein